MATVSKKETQFISAALFADKTEDPLYRRSILRPETHIINLQSLLAPIFPYQEFEILPRDVIDEDPSSVYIAVSSDAQKWFEIELTNGVTHNTRRVDFFKLPQDSSIKVRHPQSDKLDSRGQTDLLVVHHSIIKPKDFGVLGPFVNTIYFP